MRHRPSQEHQEAVARRLALLSAELTSARSSGTLRDDRTEPPDDPVEDWWQRPAGAVPVGPIDTDVAADVPVSGPVPDPGRHASRRRLGGVMALVPGPVRGRIGIGPGPIAVVAVLVALALAVTCWWVVRSSSTTDPVAPPLTGPTTALVPVETPAVAGASPGQPPVTPVGDVTVDVAGKVRRPGIAVLAAGSRVVDAIEAAGGARKGVDLTDLNLARLLVDGEQVLVGEPAAVVPGINPTAPAAPGSALAPGALVNINLATEAELDQLPDVGPVTARSIIAWRDEHGGFTAIGELIEVDGIGEATLARLTPHVTV